ncbi:MAG: hypothetical protein DWQ37_01325 [Planctomycetota bacterium]|nr:MAG: hypothetical protein DWQ37_01325 [Planctomycetota bacterium]
MKCFRYVLGILFLCVAAGRVEAIELILNGGFETGNFAGWTVTDQLGGSGSWFVDDDGVTPLSGMTSVGPASGQYFAISDQSGPGAHVLEQLFFVPGPAQSVILSFDMFVNDFDNGPIVNPAGLDYTASPNQHARVDILMPAASPFDTGAGVLANYYLGVDPQPLNPNPYTPYSFDITALVGAGGPFKLRFAEVDTAFFLNQGVDNVSIQFRPIPEPSAVVLAAIGLAALVLQGGRRNRPLT